MGIFSKKNKSEEFFRMLEEKSAAPAPFEIVEPSKEKRRPEHVLTEEEILSEADAFEGGASLPEKDPLAAMRERMLKNVAQNSQAEEKSEPQVKESNASLQSAHVSTDEPRRVEPPQKPAKSKDSLLSRCMPYIIDEDGNDTSIDREPLYKLESVADILRTDSEQKIEELSAKYGIEITEIKTQKPKNEEIPPKKTPEKTETVEKKEIKPTRSSEREKEIFEEILAELKSTDIEENEPKELPHISDIDNAVIPRSSENTDFGSTATIRFTPVKNEGESGRISISTVTRQIDLTDEFSVEAVHSPQEYESGQLEQTEFEEFEVKEEYNSAADEKKLLYMLSLKKRTAFIQTVLSAFLLLINLCFVLPSLHDFILTNVRNGMIACVCLFVLSVAVNCDIFVSLKKLFSKRSTPDCMAAFASAALVLLGVFAIKNSQNELEILLLGTATLFFRALSKFYQASARLGNFKQISVKRPKKAVSLLTDEATTVPMARNAIDGPALIAVGRDSTMIKDFMKYSEYSSVLGGKMRMVSVMSLLISISLGAVAAAYFSEAIQGFYTAATVLLIAANPILFFLDALPEYKAAIRLNKKGSMIAGMAAARHIENANAVVMKSHELFPDGTVLMHNMQVLSDNNIDEILLRAASLTEAVDSPLAAIFKKIAGTNKAYTVPDSDTVKYEDKMGLSGWVDDELMFIGNRTLMQAHNIAVPDVEVDRKILRKGYFPVYIATGGKACAMLMVQYNVKEDIAHELHKLTSLGVTVLVDSCDPNLTDEMICDYIGLYEDSVKTMANSGVHMYRNATAPTESCSAPAAYKGNPINLISVINCASRMKRSALWLTVMYVIFAVLTVSAFAYISFAGSDLPLSGSTVLLCQLGSALLSYIVFLLRKP